MRTFALSSLLGTSAVLASDFMPGLPYLVGLGYFGLIVTFFWHERRATDHEVGITTQISAMLVFIIGTIVPSQPLFASSLAVIVSIVLALKVYTTRLVDLLMPEELIATMKLLLVTVVLLPLLPNEPVDPWGIYNPRELWLLVLMISGIGFLAYFLIRFMGARRGLTLTGILGGLASSTAVTLAMSRQVQAHPESRTVLLSSALAIMLANAFMFVRIAAAVAMVNIKLIQTLWLPFTLMAIPGMLIAFGMWLRVERYMGNKAKAEGTDNEPDLELQNPFELLPAFRFALLLMVITGGAHFLQSFFGGGAIYLAAVFGGLAETNAISPALARMELVGELTPQVATQAIVLAILTNSVVKAVLSTIIGSRQLGLYVAAGLLPIFAAGLISAFFMI